MNMKRMRGRNHRPNNNGGGGGGYSRNQQNGIPLNRNHVFDSTGPEMRQRGTAQQLHEKYTQLARDASSGGDRVTGESYYQHAEHYFRIISAINQAQGQPQPVQQPAQPQQNGYNNGQNEYRRPQQPYNGNGNGYTPEPQEQPEQRAYEPRPAPRQDYQERRPERPRDIPAAPRFDQRIDISSALEAELEAAATPPSQVLAPVPATPAPAAAESTAEPRAIPIMAAPPEEPAAATPRRRGRPRLLRPSPAETTE